MDTISFIGINITIPESNRINITFLNRIGFKFIINNTSDQSVFFYP